MTDTTLPPDPDKFNAMRAKQAAKAVAAHATAGYSASGVAGLLTNLRHWCDRNGVVWADAIAAAAASYKHETRVIKPPAPKRRKPAPTTQRKQ